MREDRAPRRTSLAQGGGCGYEFEPATLRQVIATRPAAGPFERLLVGNETADDAAVWKRVDGICLIATTDFFTPMVGEPAVHALTDGTGSGRSLDGVPRGNLQHSGPGSGPRR
jgi:selenophosphate synthase